jgi:solute carrier family 45 protein 1/2/4
MPPKRPPIHPSPTPSALGGKSKAQPPPALKTPQPGGPAQHPKIVQFRSGSDAPSNENSPLLRPSFPADNSYSKSTDNGSEEEDYFMDDEEEETKSTFFLFLLTLGGLGLQIGWSVETSNGSVSITDMAPEGALLTTSGLGRTC